MLLHAFHPSPGHAAKQDAVDGAKDVLIRYWRSLHSEYDQQRWEELFDISAGDPEGWADQVWPSEDEP